MNEVEKKREYTVTLSNVLTQKSRHQLSLQEQKAILYIVSMIRPDSEELTYTFNIADYIKVCGIKNSGTNYNDLKNTLVSLRDKSWTLEDEKTGDWVSVSWLTKARGNKRNGLVQIRLDEDLMPYLLDLKERFTQYELINILALTSAYAIQLYQTLKSYEWIHQWEVSVEEFKKQFMIDQKASYRNWGQVKRDVIDVSVKQINENTDLNISYSDNGTRGRKTTKIVFQIGSKKEQKIAQLKERIHLQLNENLGEGKPVFRAKKEKRDYKIDFISPQKPEGQRETKEKIEQYYYYSEMIRENLLYDQYREKASENHKDDFFEFLDTCYELILEILCSNTVSIRIAKDEMPIEIVKARLLKLEASHMTYVYDCMNENTTKVKNTKGYLLTTLYNAPVTMSPYYKQKVNHDLETDE